MSEPEATTPDFTILAEDRLVAYIWSRPQGGHLRRGSGADKPSLLVLAYAEIAVFDRQREPLLTQLAEKAIDLDAFFFTVQLEGLRLVSGPATPHPRLGRF